MTSTDNSIVINDILEHPITFYTSLGVVAPAATADVMRVEGHGEYKKSELQRVYGVRSSAATTQRNEVSSGNALEIAFTPPVVPNTEVTIRYKLESSRQTAEFNNYQAVSSKENFWSLSVNPTDTAATVLAKIYNLIKFESHYSHNHLIVDAVGNFSTGLDVNGAALVAGQTALAATVTQLNIENTQNYTKLVIIDIQGADSLPSAYLTVFKPTESRAGNVGYNDWRWMTENVRVRSDESTSRFAIYDDQVIPRNGTYSEFRFEIVRDRDDQFANNVFAGMIRSKAFSTLYLNELNCEPTIDLVADFLNQVTVPVAPVYSALVAGTRVNETATLAEFKTNV